MTRPIIPALLIVLGCSGPTGPSIDVSSKSTPIEVDGWHFANRDRLEHVRTTIASCELVLSTAMELAENNHGIYPLLNNIAAALPDGELLLNPYTQRKTEPSGEYAVSPGEVSYLVIVDRDGYNVGCRVMGADYLARPVFDETVIGEPTLP